MMRTALLAVCFLALFAIVAPIAPVEATEADTCTYEQVRTGNCDCYTTEVNGRCVFAG
jgi:hypothetical protein